MGQQFDDLTRALATGRSRRVALKRLAAGLAGAALATVAFGRAAEAQPWFADQPNECVGVCKDAGLRGRELGRCVKSCATCVSQGGMHFFVNGSEGLCSNF